jgi:hypothetical protein
MGVRSGLAQKAFFIEQYRFFILLNGEDTSPISKKGGNFPPVRSKFSK